LDKDSRVSASFFQVANNCASGETRGGAGGGLEPGSRATHLPICPRMCDAQDYSMGLAAAMMKGAWDLQGDGGSASDRPRTSVCVHTCGVWREQPMCMRGGCSVAVLNFSLLGGSQRVRIVQRHKQAASSLNFELDFRVCLFSGYRGLDRGSACGQTFVWRGRRPRPLVPFTCGRAPHSWRHSDGGRHHGLGCYMMVPDPRARLMDDGLALALVPSGETERTLAATASRMGSASAPCERDPGSPPCPSQPCDARATPPRRRVRRPPPTDWPLLLPTSSSIDWELGIHAAAVASESERTGSAQARRATRSAITRR